MRKARQRRMVVALPTTWRFLTTRRHLPARTINMLGVLVEVEVLLVMVVVVVEASPLFSPSQ